MWSTPDRTAQTVWTKRKASHVVDVPGERIWRSYLSDHMRCRRQPGWRLPVPHWHAIWVVGMASATVFRRATKVPSILIPRRLESRLKPLRFENRRLSDQARRPKPKLRVTL